ncbi:MAG: hypothetical protein RL060_2203 [Bacteroidota bacterium]
MNEATWRCLKCSISTQVLLGWQEYIVIKLTTMNRFTTPSWVKANNIEYDNFRLLPPAFLLAVKNGLSRFKEPNPEVSIVIPAWNEGKNLLKTLASLSQLKLPYKTELIIVNNNSTDDTQEILDYFGIKSFFQPIQGISITRQMGLENAKGKYILSADADSLYPETWGIDFVQQLKNPRVSVVYGRYSFIPSSGNRFWLGIHEILAEAIFYLRSHKKACINVMGFNCAFLREEALKIGGYSKVNMKWEDGMLAKRLSENFGEIVVVTSADARPWTSDRRLMADGSLWKAFVRRVKKELSYIHELLPFGKWKVLSNSQNSLH